MAEVTGSIGNEQVRLRGMALEDTQYQMLQALNKIARETGNSPKAKAREKVEEAATSAFGAVLSTAGGAVGKLTGAITTAGKTLASITGNFDTIGRTIRGYDSSIRDSSFAMRQMALSQNDYVAAFGRFSAESVSQLEEQYDVYKRLSNVGGATAVDFENLRIKAAGMGVTMQEYLGLVESNVQNLKMGGQGVRTSMARLSNAVTELRDGGGELNDKFMRLGVGASDYGQMILDNTMAMGGFGRITDTTSQSFQEKMLKSTTLATGFADALGVSREIMIKNTNDALKDARNRFMVRKLEREGDGNLMRFFTGALGSGQAGIDAMVAMRTGRFSKEMAMVNTVTQGQLLPALQIMGEEFNKTPDDMAGAMERSRDRMNKVGVSFDSMRAGLNAQAESAYKNSELYGEAYNIAGNLIDALGNPEQLKQNFATMEADRKSANAGQIDALGELQRRTIDTAKMFAATNKSLNNFGLTAGFVTLFLTKTMGKVAGGALTSIDGIFKEIGGPDFVKEMTGKGDQLVNEMGEILKSTLGDIPGVVGKVIKDDVIQKSAAEKAAEKPAKDGTRVETPVAQAAPRANYNSQIIAGLNAVQPNLVATGVNEDGTPKRPRNVGLQVKLPKNANVDEKVNFKQQVDALMEKYKLNKEDYKINEQFLESGGYMQLEMTPEGAKKFNDNYMQGTKPQPAALKNPTVTPVAPVKASVVNSAAPPPVAAPSSSSSNSTTDPQVQTRQVNMQQDNNSSPLLQQVVSLMSSNNELAIEANKKLDDVIKANKSIADTITKVKNNTVKN